MYKLQKSIQKITSFAVTVFVFAFMFILFETETMATKMPATPELKSASSVSYHSIEVTWKKVSEASGYVVYRKVSGGDWERISKVSSGSTVTYTDTELTCGTAYTYTVRAYRTVNGSNVVGGYSKAGISCTPVPAAPSLVSATSRSSDSSQITWKKVSGASGYVVYRKVPNGSWKRVTKITSGSTVNYKDTGPAIVFSYYCCSE